jgi:hypothetical protein
LKIEYTVLQAQTPREKRNEVRRQEDGLQEVILDKSVRAIYAFFSDTDDGKSGRDDSTGDTQLQLRPPTDLRGNAASPVSLLQATVRRRWDSLTKGGLQYPYRRGAWQIWRGQEEITAQPYQNT